MRRLVEDGPDAAFAAVMAGSAPARIAALDTDRGHGGAAHRAAPRGAAHRRRRHRRAVAAGRGDAAPQPLRRGGARGARCAISSATPRATARSRRPIPPIRRAAAGFIVLGMGKLGARRAQLFERYRPHPALRRRARALSRAARRRSTSSRGSRSELVRLMAERTGRRLCLPHRSAAAARSRLDAARRVARRRRSPITKAPARTGSAPP